MTVQGGDERGEAPGGGLLLASETLAEGEAELGVLGSAGATASGQASGGRRGVALLLASRGLPRWLLWTGAALTLLFVVLAVFADWIAPYGFNQYIAHGVRFPQQGAPSAVHWFGTTVDSEDVLSRVVYGARTSIEVVLLAVCFSIAIGVPVGLVSGYFGGWLDRVLVLVNDSIFAFPYLLLAIVIAFLLQGSVGGGVITAAIAITVVYIPQYFRVVRNTVLSVREEPYVEAGRALGARPRTVIRRYVFANVIQSVPVVASLNAADAILTLAGLSFLGIGMDPSVAAEWGYDVSRGIADAQAGFWWTGIFPGLAIILLVMGLTLVGEGLNDTLNPLLRRPGYRRVVLPPVEAAAPAAPTEPAVAAPTEPAVAAPAAAPATPASAVPAVPTVPTSPALTTSAPALAAPGSEAAPEPVIAVSGLRVWYGSDRGPVKAVDGVSFEVAPGETLGLVGESGCGKTSLGRGLLGLLPDAASCDGEIRFGGRNLLATSAAEMRKMRGPALGLIFQEPMTRLDPLMRISQQFAEALHTHEPELSDEEVRERSLESLGSVGIPPTRFDNYPHEFSGGMRQRIMIALTLALRPRFIVADEPTTSLDVLVEAQILSLLSELKARSQAGLLLITHNLGIVAEACDRVAVMYAGRIVEQGRVADVFVRPQHPYTEALLASTISLSTRSLHFIPGAPPDLVEPPSGCRFHPRCPVAMQVCRARLPVPMVGPGGHSVECWAQIPAEIPPGGEARLSMKEIAIADEA
jgi:peptide/nickel transport system permease protein